MDVVARSWCMVAGMMVLNVVFGPDPANPEHLLSRHLGVLDRIRGLGFGTWRLLHISVPFDRL